MEISDDYYFVNVCDKLGPCSFVPRFFNKYKFDIVNYIHAYSLIDLEFSRDVAVMFFEKSGFSF